MDMGKFLFDLHRFDYFYNRNDDSLISGTSGDDIINNDAQYSTLNGGNGNDSIYGGAGKLASSC